MHRFVLAAAALLATVAAPAQAGTAWLCTLSDDAVRLQCLADADPRDADPRDADPRDAGTPEAARPAAPTATVRGTSFPLDPQRSWTVDLWGPPSDAESLELLARATICYRSPGCTVTVAPVRWGARVSGGIKSRRART